MVTILLVDGPQAGREIEMEEIPDTKSIAVPSVTRPGGLDFYIRRDDSLKFYYFLVESK